MALALLHRDAVETPTENSDQALRLLTLNETANVLQLSRRTVHRMIRRKELLAFRVRGQWRVRESQLIEWLRPQQSVSGSRS
jgi:excisionase family DNA binding protein